MRVFWKAAYNIASNCVKTCLTTNLVVAEEVLPWLLPILFNESD